MMVGQKVRFKMLHHQIKYWTLNKEYEVKKVSKDKTIVWLVSDMGKLDRVNALALELVEPK